MGRNHLGSLPLRITRISCIFEHFNQYINGSQVHVPNSPWTNGSNSGCRNNAVPRLPLNWNESRGHSSLCRLATRWTLSSLDHFSHYIERRRLHLAIRTRTNNIPFINTAWCTILKLSYLIVHVAFMFQQKQPTGKKYGIFIISAIFFNFVGCVGYIFIWFTLLQADITFGELIHNQ